MCSREMITAVTRGNNGSNPVHTTTMIRTLKFALRYDPDNSLLEQTPQAGLACGDARHASGKVCWNHSAEFSPMTVNLQRATLAKIDSTGGTMLDVLFKEWARNNPEQASAINIIVTKLAEAGQQIEKIGQKLEKAGQQLYPIIEVLYPELTAAKFKKRYDETGVTIQTDEAARLALLIMAHHIPYTGHDPRPDGIIGTIRDYEMLACHAMLNDSISTLIEDSTTNPVAYIAVQEVLRYRRDASEEIPSELHEWAYDVAVGDRPPPKIRRGRSRYENQVRNVTIIQTMGILISCGLKATRNEASEPISAADAVSKALSNLGIELKTDSVSKIWTGREKPLPKLAIAAP